MSDSSTASTSDRSQELFVERDAIGERVREFHTTRDPDVLAAVMAETRPLAVSLAGRFRGRGIEQDDLVQVASLGMLHAVNRYDHERGVAFLSFAVPTVMGELRRHFRSAWSVHVPRGLQESVQRVRPAVEELRHSLGRPPQPAEVASHLGIGVDEVLEAMEAGAAFRVTSLDASLGSSDRSLGSALPDAGPADAYRLVEDKATVGRLLAHLSPRSRRIVELRFFEDLSQTEIAERVGISQMHVSRLLRQAISRLAAIADDPTAGDGE